MPYIKRAMRGSLEESRRPMAPGELNYLITRLLTNYILDNGLCYSNINDILGALEGAKLEFYRRIAAPYEDIKRKENGDVYE
jgi:hypothetical protein